MHEVSTIACVVLNTRASTMKLLLLALLLTQARCSAGPVQNAPCTTSNVTCTGAKRIGCVHDGSHDRLWNKTDQHLSDDGMTQELCFEFCRAQGYAYAGLECASDCYCGNQAPPASRQGGVPAWCNAAEAPAVCNASCHGAHTMPACCSGQQAETCGGFGIMEAFDIRALNYVP